MAEQILQSFSAVEADVVDEVSASLLKEGELRGDPSSLESSKWEELSPGLSSCEEEDSESWLSCLLWGWT